MEHVMIDLETLDTSPKAVVVSLGAVVFNPYSTELGEQFYAEFTTDLSTQTSRGRILSPDTVVWWMNQSAQARLLFAEQMIAQTPRMDTRSGLQGFSDFITRNAAGADTKVWGNGADFDNIILGSLYKDMELRQPWRYSNNRCYRTMKGLGIGPRAERTGVHHHALDDAITQAKHLQEIFKCLGTH